MIVRLHGNGILEEPPGVTYISTKGESWSLMVVCIMSKKLGSLGLSCVSDFKFLDY